MATASAVYTEKEVVIVEKELTGITLNLSIEEAQQVKDILGRFNAAGNALNLHENVYYAIKNTGLTEHKHRIVVDRCDFNDGLGAVLRLDKVEE